MPKDQENPIWIVVEFQREIPFPKFTMQQGERWRFKQTSNHGMAYEKALQINDDRFAFAGGQCLLQDIKEIYRGDKSPEHCYGLSPLSL